MVLNDDKLLAPWKERKPSNDFMGGDILTTEDYEFPRNAVTTMEIRLIGNTDELLLAPVTFDFSLVNGKPRAAIKQQ